MKQLRIGGKAIPRWTIILALLALGSAAVCAATMEPYAEAYVSTSLSGTIESITMDSTYFDSVASEVIGQGQYAKMVLMGQGNDYGFHTVVIRNNAANENIYRVWIEGGADCLKLKMSLTNSGSELFDELYIRIGGETTGTVYLYTLVRPGCPPCQFGFTLRIEPLNGHA